MLKLISPQTTPPGGFRATVVETGQTFHAWTHYALKQQLLAHFSANNLPIRHDLDFWIEDQTCQGLPRGFCEETDAVKAFLASLRLTWNILSAATRSLGSWGIAGFKKVEQPQAESRAAICVDCVHNQYPKDCAPCQFDAALKLITAIVGTDKTKSHDKLNACNRCGCFLKVKVWAPLEFVIKIPPLAEYPAHCWITKERLNV